MEPTRHEDQPPLLTNSRCKIGHSSLSHLSSRCRVLQSLPPKPKTITAPHPLALIVDPNEPGFCTEHCVETVCQGSPLRLSGDQGAGAAARPSQSPYFTRRSRNTYRADGGGGVVGSAGASPVMTGPEACRAPRPMQT